MPPKLESKDLEEILQAIRERLSVIQAQMEATKTRQTNIEARNEFLHSLTCHKPRFLSTTS